MLKLIFGIIPLLLHFKYASSVTVNNYNYQNMTRTFDKLETNRHQITLNIITNNRPKSLTRLLTSIKGAEYYNNSVHIRFSIDSDADRQTIGIIDDFQWPYGHKTVQKRIEKGGLMKAVAESWYPASDDDHAIFLEDDIEVSKYFMRWVLYAIKTYEGHDNLAGISLYNPTFSEVTGKSLIAINNAYLYQFPSSWGCLFFGRSWREFHNFISNMLVDEFAPYVPFSRTNNWTHSWKKYFVSYMYEESKYMLYPPVSFSTNHVEPGTHYKIPSKFTLNRLEVDLYQQQIDFVDTPYEYLPTLNIYGELVN